MEDFKNPKNILYLFLSLIFIFSFVAFSTSSAENFFQKVYSSGFEPKEYKDVVYVATHVETPEQVKALYMSSWVAGTPSIRSRVVNLADTTEINSIMIDIKDYTGKISFEVSDPYLQEIGSSEDRISDIKEFIEDLHKRGVYVIGRIAVFQDPYFTKLRPDLSVKKESNKQEPWQDYKGLNFIDVGAVEFWDYILAIARESYRVGFDEINFDYIRFPSDGNMKDIYYPFSDEKIVADPDNGKAVAVEEFFKYIYENLKDSGIKTSADLFGMVTTNNDDLNIGQVLERALPYFDYIAPMTYPSHYPSGFNGYKDPNKNVYGVIKYSLDEAMKKIQVASSTPNKLRPWLQDFDYGGNYGEKEVRDQIQAVYDAGFTSWMLWDPANKYTPSALNKI